MKSILLCIQSTVLKYTNIIANVIKVDVEVVDTDLYRIAGTGKFGIQINEKMSSNGYVYSHVLEVKKVKIITNPGFDICCENCKNYRGCKETFEIAVPIKMKGQVIGVIGLVSFNEQQKEVLENDIDVYIAFIELIAEFIGIKAYEYMKKNRKLEQSKIINDMIEKINQGTIAIDNIQGKSENNCIINCDSEYNDKTNIIGRSKEVQQLRKDIKKISKSSSTILIYGESGSGKEFIAYNIWKNQKRFDTPFVVIDCDFISEEISEEVLEEEIFGCVNINSLDNQRDKIGKLEIANNGVLFINNIQNMPIKIQNKLLRVIKESKFTRLGCNNNININVRFIVGTNKNLRALVEENKFLKELYYIVNVVPINIRPLRDRKEDIEDLIYYFIEMYSDKLNKNFNKINEDVLEVLIKYLWPENVRELKNTVEYMINMMELDGVIDLNTIPPYILDNKDEIKEIIPIKDLEKKEILKALKIYGNGMEGKKKAAKKLGVSLATLYRKLEKYEVTS